MADHVPMAVVEAVEERGVGRARLGTLVAAEVVRTEAAGGIRNRVRAEAAGRVGRKVGSGVRTGVVAQQVRAAADAPKQGRATLTATDAAHVDAEQVPLRPADAQPTDQTEVRAASADATRVAVRRAEALEASAIEGVTPTVGAAAGLIVVVAIPAEAHRGQTTGRSHRPRGALPDGAIGAVSRDEVPAPSGSTTSTANRRHPSQHGASRRHPKQTRLRRYRPIDPPVEPATGATHVNLTDATGPASSCPTRPSLQFRPSIATQPVAVSSSWPSRSLKSATPTRALWSPLSSRATPTCPRCGN